MNFFLRFLDIVFIARPILFIPVWGFALFGYWNGLKVRGLTDSFFRYSLKDAFVLFPIFLFSLVVGSVYVINQIADRKVDEENGGFPLLVKSGLSSTAAWIYAAALTLASICGFLALRMPFLMPLVIAALLLGICYSFKPFYFSGRPFLDFVANAFGYGAIAFGVGWLLVPGTSLLSFVFLNRAAPYFLLMAAGSINSTLPDFEGDKKGGKITTAVCLGMERAHILAFILLILAGCWGGLNRDWIIVACVIGAVPVYSAYLFSKTQKLMEATYKVGGGLTMLVAGLIFPWFTILSCIMVLLTVIYFRLRHGVSYPSLVPVR